MDKNKPILDVTCGGRTMWFNKNNPCVLYVDRRQVDEVTLCGGRKFSVQPDMIADFTKLPFADNSFFHVVFDPPHLINVNDDTYMALKYTKNPPNWEESIHAGFWECMRVLKPYGTLIFKWSEIQIKTSKVIEVIQCSPLYGHISGKKSKTHWMAFVKGVSDLEQAKIL